MMSKTNAAELILREHGRPMSPKEIVSEALSRGLIETRGKTPDATLSVEFRLEVKRRSARGSTQRFKKFGVSLWGLAEWK